LVLRRSNTVMSLSAEAEKRKERLLALKKRKRGQNDDLEAPSETPVSPNNDSTQPDSSKPYFPHESRSNPRLPLSGRNYDATTRTTKLGFTESPLSKLPEDFETVEEVAINLAIEAIHAAEKQSKDAAEVDLFSLQPKRPNWDLKRDVEKKLERLKPKTDAAIARLLRQRLTQEKKADGKDGAGDNHTEGDLAKMVEMREREEREESV
jgi:coiled-coil domain-containing protein 12